MAMIAAKRSENLGCFLKTPAQVLRTRKERRSGRDLERQPIISVKLRQKHIFELLLEFHEHGVSWPVSVESSTDGVKRVSLCHNAWAVFNGFPPSTVRALRLQIKNGRRNYGRGTSTVGKITGKTDENSKKKLLIIAWLKRQANNKVGMGADIMPTENGLVHLPLFNKNWAYIEYCKQMRNPDIELPSYSYFTEVWRGSKELRKVRTQRNVGTLPKCSTCKSFEEKLLAVKNANQVELAKIEAEFRGHVFLQQFERRAYAYKQMLAYSESKEFLSCIIDSSTQFPYHVPYTRDQFKDLDSSGTLKQSLTAVHFHGRDTYIYPYSKFVNGGSNWTIQCLLEALSSEASKEGHVNFPRTWFIQMDNCSGENKNKFVFAFLSTLVAKGYFDTIVVSFLPTGHTHEDVDQLFSILAARLRVNGIHLSREEFDALLKDPPPNQKTTEKQQKSFKVNRLRATGDYKAFLGPTVSNEVKGYLKPHCFVFDVKVKQGVRTCQMRYREYSVSETWFPLPVVRDGEIHPNDVYAEAQQEQSSDAKVKAESRKKSEMLEERIKTALERQADEEIAADNDGDYNAGNNPQRTKRLKQESNPSAATGSGDGNVLPQSVLLDPNAEVYMGAGFLKHESDASRKSYHDSPGLTFASMAIPELSEIPCAPVVVIPAEDNKLIQKNVFGWLKNFAKMYPSYPKLPISAAVTSWEDYFNTLPEAAADIRPEDFQIDWMKLLGSWKPMDVMNKAPVICTTVRKLIEAAAGDMKFGGDTCPVSYPGSKQRAAKKRVFAEVADLAGESRPGIEKNAFIICLRSEDDTVQEGKGFSPAEEKLPFYLAKTVNETAKDCPDSTMMPIVYWRQVDGNPNRAFIEGIQAGVGNKKWMGSVERSSVLFIDPLFLSKSTRGSKYLHHSTLQGIANVLNPKLLGWSYDEREGCLVKKEVITEVNVGDFFVVSWNSAPLAIRKDLTVELKSAGILVVEALNPVTAEGVQELEAIDQVKWYRFVGDDVNAKFKELKVPDSAAGQKKQKVGAVIKPFQLNTSELLVRLTVSEGVQKKMTKATKQKLFEGKFQTLLAKWKLNRLGTFERSG